MADEDSSILDSSLSLNPSATNIGATNAASETKSAKSSGTWSPAVASLAPQSVVGKKLGGRRIAIIGGGVVGLSSAVQLQQALNGLSVDSPWYGPITLIADRFERDTVSDGAAGSFRPTGDYIPGVPKNKLRSWCEDSFRYYSSLANSEEASEAGVSVISGHHVFVNEKKEQDQTYKDFVYDYRKVEPKDITRMYANIDKPKAAVAFTTLMIECRWFLPYLMKKFKKAGGVVEERHIQNLKELIGQYDLVVNCTGMGSRELVADSALSPIRGQMLKVKAPWIKNFLYVDNNCWIIPGKEWVVIGGTRQEHDEDPNVREGDSVAVMYRATRAIPSLKRAEVLEAWVGFRPAREPIRLELEYFDGTKLPVVHNYGHGGNGVSLAWGTGTEVLSIVMQHIQAQTSKL